MSAMTRLAAGVLGALVGIALLVSAPAFAETYTAIGYIDDSDEGQEFIIPMGEINYTVDALTTGHGVEIAGDANQVINNVEWEAWMELSGAIVSPKGIQTPSQQVQLDAMGDFARKYSISNVTTLTQGFFYTCRATAVIKKNGEEQATFDHTHHFVVNSDPRTAPEAKWEP